MPASRTNTGAQKWVTQRVKYSAGVAVRRSTDVPTNMRVWSSAISTMTTPRSQSIASLREDPSSATATANASFAANATRTRSSGATAPCPPPGVLILRIPEKPSTSPCLARLLLLRIDGTRMPRDENADSARAIAAASGQRDTACPHRGLGRESGGQQLAVRRSHCRHRYRAEYRADDTEPDPLRHLPPADQCETLLR